MSINTRKVQKWLFFDYIMGGRLIDGVDLYKAKYGMRLNILTDKCSLLKIAVLQELLCFLIADFF